MKIRVDSLEDQEIKVEEDISADSWNMDNLDIKFVENIHLDCKFKKIGKEILVDTDVVTHRMITCSRCLESVRQEVEQKSSFAYNVDDLGEYLDIDDDVREDLLLNFPMKVLCVPECKGLCPGCGTNLNQGECNCNK
jgi:uncharacterized protein